MSAGLYWLEDYFDTQSQACDGRLSRAATRLLSEICASLGDALADRTMGRRLFTLPD